MAMEDATLVKHTKQTFVLRSDATGDEFPLQGEMLVGREVECAIPLNSGHISRYHAKINVSNNGVYIEDLHSTNGTFVNGGKIKGRVKISVGDEISFDDIRFRLVSNRSGSEASTQLTPRRHGFHTSTPASVAPIRPSVSNKPAPIEASLERQVDDLRDSPLDELDNIDLSQRPRAASRSRQPQSDHRGFAEVQPEPQQPERVQPEPDQPDSVSADDQGGGTQLLSAMQLDDLIERHRDEPDVSLGSGPRFVVMTAPIRGKIFTLSGSPNTHNWKIGRDETSEVCLNDKTISSDHARLAYTAAGEYILSATHAKNGIFVNGQLQTKAHLKHDDKIQIGRTELVFKTDEGSAQSNALYNSDPLADSVRVRQWGVYATVAIIVVLIAAMTLTGK